MTYNQTPLYVENFELINKHELYEKNDSILVLLLIKNYYNNFIILCGIEYYNKINNETNDDIIQIQLLYEDDFHSEHPWTFQEQNI